MDKRFFPRRWLCHLLLANVWGCGIAWGQASLQGQTGYIHAPSARIERDGTWTLGVAYDNPYFSVYNNVAILPFLEGTLKFNQIRGVKAFPNQPGNNESYKDEEFDLKLRLTDEDGMLPAVAIGIQDYFGTRLFASEYIVATKTFGSAEVSVGYAPDKLSVKSGGNTGVVRDDNRMHGVFWGARVPLGSSPFSIVAEKNPIDFSQDRHPFTGAPLPANTRKSAAYAAGLEYRWEWVGAQVAKQGDEWTASTYVRIPLWQSEFVPKIAEPAPYMEIIPRPTRIMWESDNRYYLSMLEALKKQGFINVNARLDDTDVLHVSLGHHRISKMSRAVGRAVRTILLLSPASTREIRLTYLESGLPLITYEFVSPDALQRYLNGTLTRKALRETVNIRFSRPSDADAALVGQDEHEVIAGVDDENHKPLHIVDNETGNLVAVRSTDSKNSFSFVPFRMSTMSKSASGYYQYQVYSSLRYTRQMGDGWSAAGSVMLRLDDNFKPFPGGSNSASQNVPVVRSDAFDYVNGQRIRLQRLYANRNFQVSERVYGRVTGGFLEDMYAGVQGQVLYFPDTAPWAADVEVSALQKRAYDSQFGMRDYKTVTAFGSLHYRLPMGFGVTTRVGRFLARDLGARFEVTRRFNSGFEAGAWLGYTNANDLNAPGSEGKPYRDKGVWVSIPFNTMTTKDTKTAGTFAWQEWGRDVAQMVDSPVDLYSMMRDGWMNRQYSDGLTQLAEVNDDYNLPSLGTSLLDRNVWQLASNDLGNVGEMVSSGNTWLKMSMGLGLVGLSTALDNSGERFAKNHGSRKLVRGIANFGNMAPLGALGLAGLAALDGSDPRLSSTGMAALQAGGVGVLASLGTKYAVGRARPEAGLGNSHFNPGSNAEKDASFFSGHTVAIWGAVTPFAKEYDMPWLYGVAGLTNFARVAKNKHWISDTVAGSLLGYWLGSTFWEWRRSELLKRSEILVGPSGVGVNVSLH